jgi:membrane dipeptidase
MDAYPTIFSSPHLNASTALDSFVANKKLISPLAIEGLHQIGNSFSNLRLYHSLGVRYATLTHNCHNAFADAAIINNSSGATIAAPPYWGGVSNRGRDVVREMNRLGMLVDLAHVSKDTMLDVLGGRPKKWKGSAAPIMFSHSSAYGLCPHPRNVPDDVLQLVKTSNSIVMINFSPDFISCTPSNSSTGIPDLYQPNSTLHQVVRHIKYVGDMIGYDHVGLGSDFDGILDTPRGLDDVSKFPDLVAELLRSGVSDEDAAKVVGRNILRVWRDVDGVALKMRLANAKPVEDQIEL